MRRLIYIVLSICVCILIAVGLYFLITSWTKSEEDLDPEQNQFFYNTHRFVNTVVRDVKNITDNVDEWVAEVRKYIWNGSLPAHASIRFYLHDQKDKNKYSEVKATKESFKKSTYEYNSPVVFLFHGYNPNINFNGHCLHLLKDAFLETGSYKNVFHVDYSSVCDAPYSYGFLRNYLVAREVAEFLKFLVEETGTKKSQIHLIGYSVGAMVAGSTGIYLKGIGRITGLEPAGYFFYFFPDDLVINKNQAEFVDIVHTNAIWPFPGGLGLNKVSGHLDVFVNGGQWQPDCNSTDTNVDVAPYSLAEIEARGCMHERAVHLYTESVLNKECSFVATLCDSNDKFNKGLCSQSNATTATVLINATKPVKDFPPNTRFYMNTNDQKPYCKSIQP